MATKSISLKTKKAILIDQSAFLASVNALRLSRGATKKSKAPTTIQRLLSNTKVLEVSTEDFGSIGFSICYEDKDGIGCRRRYLSTSMHGMS